MASVALDSLLHHGAPTLRFSAAPAGPQLAHEGEHEPPAPGGSGRAGRHEPRAPTELRLVEDAPLDPASGMGAPVLVAGGDAARRAQVLENLAATLAPETTFEQTGACWEVLALASSSQMVVLSGDLDEAPAAALVRILGRRHPRLPVVSVQGPMRAAP